MESFPVNQPGGEVVFALRDPEGFSGTVVLPYAAAVLASLMDGNRTLAELQEAFERQSGASVDPADVEQVVSELDDALLSRRRAISCAMEGGNRAYLNQSGPCRGACRQGL